ncbi:hypothetical protein BCR44DRAFT_34814 [Catenaria anguillulae PL171]|uniref:PIH1D1/2/3 CS-like domain-containing protein n=1 Tax=Catenaria anguillulae PL171 TaxID=765915 RepID=A0A1Y2I1V3_9FUNG|nr:hypothetical protein BCR44DRAFT_34814 [Catenaria anguillulae PL171]
MEDMQSASYGTTEALSALTRLFESNLECEAPDTLNSRRDGTPAHHSQAAAGTRVQSTTNAATGKRKPKRLVYNYADKSIWTKDELASASSAQAAEHATFMDDSPSDSRARPEYTIQYGFDVTSEDVYLGLGGKCNSMQHADHLKVAIELPLVKVKDDVQVDVTSNGVVELASPHYRLSLPLPNPVDETKGVATWDPDVRRLTLKLPLVKMFPF